MSGETLDLDRLRAIAQGVVDEEVCPGDADWHLVSDDEVDSHHIVFDRQGESRPPGNGMVARCSVASDAQHIAAFRPRVALALVDEVATLRAEVASLTALHAAARKVQATHRCTVCGALWIDQGESWSLASTECGTCCDNVEMGSQIEPVGLAAEVASLTTERDEERQNAAVEAKLGDEARASLAQLRALHRDTIRAALPEGFTVREDGSPVDWVLALRHAYDEGRVEVERLRSDLAAIWTTCTGIVSTAADGPDADNIPRRVEELRERVEELFAALSRWGAWAHSPEGAGELFEAAVEGTPAECFPADTEEAPGA